MSAPAPSLAETHVAVAQPVESSAAPAAEKKAEASKPVAKLRPGIRGRVSDVLGFPLVGALVASRAERGRLAAALEPVVTGADGRYEIVFPGLLTEAELDRRLRDQSVVDEEAQWRRGHGVRRERTPRDELNESLELVVVAAAAGYEPASERVKVVQAAPEHLEVDFQLVPAQRIDGTVEFPAATNHEQRRVPGAQVFLLDSRFEVVGATVTSYEGDYSLYVRAPGRHHLFARKESVGTGYLGDLEVDPTILARMPAIVVHGPASLRGQVVYPDGRAVVALEVEALHSLAAAAGDAGRTETGRIRLELDQGLVMSGGCTDDYGRFVFGGLQQGEFEVRFPTDPGSAGERTRCATGPSVHKLVFRGYRLRVEVWQERASPAGVPQVSVSKLLLDADAQPVERLQGLWSRNGAWYASVEPGERYLVKAWASSLQYDWKIVEIPPASYETTATLYLVGDYEKASKEIPGGGDATTNPYAGALEVRVVDAEGKDLGDWRATLRSADGTMPRGSLDAAKRQGKPLALPPGAYTVDVALASSDSLAVLEDSRRAIVIRPGATAKERFQATLGARIAIDALADGSFEPAKAGEGSKQAEDEFEELLDPRRASSLRAWYRRAGEDASANRPLRFRRTDKKAASKDAASKDEGVSADGEWLRLGSSAACDPVLPAGDYVVTFEPGRGNARDVEIELRRGEVRRLDFVPKR